MAHARVLLKREYRTPLGRFAKSIDGVPTEIPQAVIRRYPLPKDAEVVGEDYIVPSEREDVYATSADMTSAEIEAEIARRVNERIAAQEAGARGAKNAAIADASEAAADADDILDESIAAITEALPGMSEDELVDLLHREREGKTRKGVVLALEAALEEC